MITQEQFNELVTVEKIVNWLESRDNNSPVIKMNDPFECLFGQYLRSVLPEEETEYCIMGIYYAYFIGYDRKFPKWAQDLQSHVIYILDTEKCEISDFDLLSIIKSEEYIPEEEE